MPKKRKAIVVREHRRRVSKTKKNPSGITIVDRHLRHIEGQYLDKAQIENIFKNYDKKNILYPSKGKLGMPDEDKYDEYIAVWTDYFNKKLNANLDPNMIKALIPSESSFNPNAINLKATGLTQITTDTLKIVQDLEGETKEFVFKGILKKDLKDPNVSISIGTRWLAYKQKYATKALKTQATGDEIIQAYKGILKDGSDQSQKIMKKFRTLYGKFKNK